MSYMITAERQSLLSTALTSARSEDAFSLALRRITTAFGFSHFSLLNAPAMDYATLADLIVETSLPASFIKDFDAARTPISSTIFGDIRQSVMPRTWHIGEKRAYSEGDSPGSIAGLLEHHGIPMGIICPVHNYDGQRLVFCFSGNRGPLAQSEINELYMIVLQAVEAYNDVKATSKTPAHPLSARELEVVRWTAQGKTSIEIGQILSLSDHTINAYMNNAMKKLDCVNRTQLVAKTIRLKLIS